jgi:hypothetical protein
MACKSIRNYFFVSTRKYEDISSMQKAAFYPIYKMIFIMEINVFEGLKILSSKAFISMKLIIYCA